MDAEDGLNDFNFIKLHWTVHPEREQEWRDEQDKLLGPSLAAQECDCDFITSGQSVVDGVILDEYRENHIRIRLKRGVLIVMFGYGNPLITQKITWFVPMLVVVIQLITVHFTC